jgi:hypothetical protein
VTAQLSGGGQTLPIMKLVDQIGLFGKEMKFAGLVAYSGWLYFRRRGYWRSRFPVLSPLRSSLLLVEVSLIKANKTVPSGINNKYFEGLGKHPTR